METLNDKTDVQVVRIRRPDGSEDRVHLFLDKQGYLTGANNLQALAGWSRNSSLLAKIPGLQQIPQAGGGFKLVASSALQQNLRFFEEENPCWFEGCEELREAYRKELAAMEEDPECSGCEKNKLKVKYLHKLPDHARAQKHP